MKPVLRAGEVTADIAIDSLEVNGLAAPPLRLTQTAIGLQHVHQ